MRFVYASILALLVVGAGVAQKSGSSNPSSTPSSRPSSTPSTSSSGSTGTKSSFSVRPATSAEIKSLVSAPKTTHNTDVAGLGKTVKTPSVVAGAPKATFKTPKGDEVKVTPNSPSVGAVRSAGTSKTVVEREERVKTVYKEVHVPSTVVTHYHDPYSTLFWVWLLDSRRSADERALWYYHHRDDVDAARAAELRAKDKEFDARLAALEAKKTPVNPTFTPPTLNADAPDVMYSDEFVDAVTNPMLVEEKEVDDEPEKSSVAWWCVTVLLGLVAVAVTWLLILSCLDATAGSKNPLSRFRRR